MRTRQSEKKPTDQNPVFTELKEQPENNHEIKRKEKKIKKLPDHHSQYCRRTKKMKETEIQKKQLPISRCKK